MNSAAAITVLPAGLLDQLRADQLNLYRYESRVATNAAVAHAVATELRRLIATRGRAVGIFTAAPSHAELLAALVKAESIEWTRVIGFQLDEYLGLDEDAPPSRRRFLLDHLVKQVPMAEFHGLRGEAANPAAVAANYAALLKSRPPDFAILSLGMNGCFGALHPTINNRHDPVAVRIAELDANYRREQVTESLVAQSADVPLRALTLTIPTLMACPRLFAVAINEQVARAVLANERTAAPFTSVLRTHPDAHLFLFC